MVYMHVKKLFYMLFVLTAAIMWKELRYIIWRCRSEYDLSYYRIDAFVLSAVCKLVVYWAIVHPTIKHILIVPVTKILTLDVYPRQDTLDRSTKTRTR